MPDMHLDDQGRVVLDDDTEPTPEQRAQAIVDCGLCNDDGYRGTVICDHRDHSAAYERGMARIREILGQTPVSGTDTANTPKSRERCAEGRESASGGES